MSEIKRSLILDPIHPRDWRELNVIYCCEQCVHYDENEPSKTRRCTLGYDSSNHLKETQDQRYLVTGRVAFCRFSEID